MHLQKFADDSVLFDFDCTNLLASGETITGTPAMTQWPAFPGADPALLVFGTAVVNAAPVTYPDGRVMAVGKGFQVRISGGLPITQTLQRVYQVMGTFTTTAGNTMTANAPLWLLAPGAPLAGC